MKNKEVAELFETFADVLEIKGEIPFKPNAYRRAARVIRDLTEDIEVVAQEGRLRELSGVGKATASKIIEYLTTGRIQRFEEAKEGVPPGLLDMLAIPGMGPKGAALVHKQLGIDTVDALGEAARAGRLRSLPGMGAKKEENILRGIEMLAESSKRTLLGEAMPVVERVIAHLKSGPAAEAVPAGSLRRMKETVGDLDVLATGPRLDKVIEQFTQMPEVERVLASGETRASVVVEEGLQIDLRAVPPESFGAALQYFTGSKAHNIRLREMAQRDGLKINEYGVFKGKMRIAGKDEAEVYKVIGLPWIPPALREDRGEIEAAAEGRLPALVQQSDIRGDLHVHSTWSDGKCTIEEMAKAAKALGYRYIAFCDHTRLLKVFGGLSEKDVLKQVEEIRELDGKIKGIRLLAGTEVDIRSDGVLDLSDEVLAVLDVVTASIHSAFKQPEKRMTARLIRAIENPHVDVIGHPTGRLLGARDAYALDLDAVLKAAAATGTAVELNAHPARLDLNDVACRRAKELGVKVAVNTDAHDAQQLHLIRYGVATAQRGWLEKKDVVNTAARPRFGGGSA